MRKLTRRTGTVAVATVAAIGVGVAFAAWTSNGTGSGTAQSLTSEDSTISAGVNAADLFPGAVKSVTVTIDNTNDYPVVVTSISSGTSGALSTPTCAADTVTSDARALDNTGLVQSDNSTKTIGANSFATYTLVTHMIADPSDGCKSRTFNLPLTATLRSNAS